MNAGHQSECAFVCTLMYGWAESNSVRMQQKKTDTVSYSQYNYNTAWLNWLDRIPNKIPKWHLLIMTYVRE